MKARIARLTQKGEFWTGKSLKRYLERSTITKVGTRFLLSTFLLQGCGGLIAGAAYKDLDVNQLKAVNESGAALTSCLSIGGPPIGGRTVFFVVPKGSRAVMNFLPDCQVKDVTVYYDGLESMKQLQESMPATTESSITIPVLPREPDILLLPGTIPLPARR